MVSLYSVFCSRGDSNVVEKVHAFTKIKIVDFIFDYILLAM